MSNEVTLESLKDMDYETAVTELNSLITILERNEGTFDELIQVYKKAFVYYTYCTEYLHTAADKIKDLNVRMAELLSKGEEQ